MPERAVVETDVCIIGAGPHGLAAAIHLREADAGLGIRVLDLNDRWLTTWNEQFAKARIETLRSPIVHHPAPDPEALMRFANEHDLPRSGMPYDLPTTGMFAAFCQVLVEDAGLDDPHPARPTEIRSEGQRVRLAVGEREVLARHVIVASNPHSRTIPDWTWQLIGHQPGLLEFGLDVDLRTMPDLRGEHVAIVGGGLTAAHLTCGAAALGAVVHLIARRPLQIRSFDTDPGWLGPKYLSGYSAESDPVCRLELARAARAGGSIPGWMHETLRAHIEGGTVELSESTEVRTAEVCPAAGCRLQLSNGSTVDVGRVWLATGTRPDIGALRCLRPLLADVPTLQGLPVVDQGLRLGPHPIFVMGRLATVALGPAAGNLWGAQRAARYITETITGIDLELERIGGHAGFQYQQQTGTPPVVE